MSREVIWVLDYSTAKVTKYILSDEKQEEFDNADFDDFMDKFFKDNHLKESQISWMITQCKDVDVIRYD